MINAISNLKVVAMAVSVVAMAIGPSILHSGLSQPEASGPANSILISSSAKSYKCTTTPETPATLGIHVSAVKEGGTLKGQWHIIGSEFGEKKGTITGGTLDKAKYDLKGKETIDTLCSGNTPKDITIFGNCGAGQQINFRITAGSHEIFNGRAHCSELLL